MPEQKQHPSVDDLTAFSAGQLPAESAATVESHIGDCTPCCETLMGLSSDDTFVDLLKETRDPVHGATIGVARCAAAAGEQKSPLAALADHPRYEIVDLIAKGGMGEVFRAKHRMMDRTVAVKVIKDEFTRNPEAVERFHREVKTAAHLSHRNVVTAYDAEQADGVHFLVMEYVDGENLADLVKDSGRLAVGKACNYVQQVALGMQHAHGEGMVHRDMKPQNLMLTKDGTVKILDFGLSSLSSATTTSTQSDVPKNASLTVAGSIMGTPDFISPKQAADAHQADIRSDIYSLGATLHYLLTGQPPFAEGSVAERLRSHAEEEPASVSTFRDDVPGALTSVIEQMMAKDPAERFQTPQQVADALAPFVDANRTRPQTATGGRQWWKSGKLLASAAAIAVLLSSIIYVQTDKGTLKIDAIDNDVTLTVSKVMGESGTEDIQLDIVDTITGSNVVRLPSGEYKVSLGDQQSKYTLNQEGFTLTRGNDVVIKVSRATATRTPEAKSLPKMRFPGMAQQVLLSQGRRLTEDDVKGFRQTVDEDSGNIEARLQLLSYYHGRSFSDSDAKSEHVEMVKWVVRNYPESYSAGASQSHIFPSFSPQGFLAVKALWMEHVQRQPDNIAIHLHAAAFLQLHEKDLAEQLLIKVQKVAPQNTDIAHQLGHLYKLELLRVKAKDARRRTAAKAMSQFETAIRNEDGAHQNFHWRVDLATVSFEAGNLDQASQVANELLTNFDNGYAMHSGNLVLGRVALANGKIETAKARLLDAGRVNGGTTITTSGPNMMLAKELLESGEKEVVLEYFDLCGKFWKNEKLEQWSGVVKSGEVPDFGANLIY